MSAYRFHAAAPPGEWINDPNGLDFAEGRYRLHVQHAADAPEFKRIGWGRFTSPDLLDWCWEGEAIPPDANGAAYSGSVADGRAFLTRHLEGREPRQVQVSRPLDGGGDSASFGPAGRNVRDPFVWRSAVTGDRRMLVAEPCDWAAWAEDGPSRLSVWRSGDGAAWARAGAIGPWRPPGVLWEVPALLDFGDRQLLIVSEVDRRTGGADCAVRYWTGRFDGAAFAPDPDVQPDGSPLDLGPDFYAAIPNVTQGWPDPERLVLGWASSWATARRLSWPEARGGGPISLPRVVSLDGGRLRQRPIDVARPHLFWAADAPAAPHSIVIGRGPLRLTVEVEAYAVRVRREGDATLDWERTHPVVPRGRGVELYVDGPLVELFLGELACTAVLPGAGTPTVAVRAL